MPLLSAGCASVCFCSVAQSCPTPRDPMDWSLPGSSVQGFSRQDALGERIKRLRGETEVHEKEEGVLGLLVLLTKNISRDEK